MEQSIISDNNVNEKSEKDISIMQNKFNKNDETKIKLKQFLDRSCSNKIHTDTIIKLPTLKDAHIYCKYNNLSGQFTGPVLEKYIKIKYKMTKNKASS